MMESINGVIDLPKEIGEELTRLKSPWELCVEYTEEAVILDDIAIAKILEGAYE